MSLILDVRFRLGRICCVSVAYWSAQQNPTAEAPVCPPRGQNKHTPTNFSDIVNHLLTTNDGRGGMPN